jgi:uncharacterized membrane protein SpoIIM required for sporulation
MSETRQRQPDTGPQGWDLKSHAFRRAHEREWDHLDLLLKRLRRRGPRALTQNEILALPRLYRSAAASLAVARSISLDRSLSQYLENLCMRAFLVIYGPRGGALRGILHFFTHDFPAAVRSLWPMMLLASVVLFGGALFSGWLYFQDTSWFYSFMPDALAHGRNPEAPTERLLESINNRGTGSLDVFATFLFVHNSLVGLLAFVLGVVLGLPTVILLLYQGLLLGVFVALHIERGLGLDVGGWLLVHGVTEFLAIILCGAAGLRLGWHMAFPGLHSRRYMLAQQGQVMGQVMIGCFLMFGVAGLIEGFVRQTIIDTEVRYQFAACSALIWLLYFLFAGRDWRRRNRTLPDGTA